MFVYVQCTTILHQIHGRAECRKRAKDLFAAFDVSPEDGRSDMISVIISLYLRVHGGVDVTRLLSYFLRKRDVFLMICVGSDMLGGAVVNCRLGIAITFFFLHPHTGRTTRAAKVNTTQFSNVRCYFGVTVGQGRDV